jgi:F-type H+-transporting ATPase subunit a
MEHELGLTHLFNDYLAGPANAAMNLVGLPSEPRPWSNAIAVEILVAVLLMVFALIVRASLSPDKPGALQHTVESIYATIFIFIASMNLIGLIPAFESPTMVIYVPAGLAVWTFFYFNVAGFRTNGLGYLKHFMGPIWWMAPMMFLIEIISLFIRPLSLSVRLYGNMFAGEQVTLVFVNMTKFIIPVIFMGLHVFVALVQAYVFTMLTMIYMAGATAHGHGEGQNEENVHAHGH